MHMCNATIPYNRSLLHVCYLPLLTFWFRKRVFLTMSVYLAETRSTRVYIGGLVSSNMPRYIPTYAWVDNSDNFRRVIAVITGLLVWYKVRQSARVAVGSHPVTRDLFLHVLTQQRQEAKAGPCASCGAVRSSALKSIRTFPRCRVSPIRPSH